MRSQRVMGRELVAEFTCLVRRRAEMSGRSGGGSLGERWEH